MRKFFIVSAFLAAGVFVSGSAIADYMHPGRIIIGYTPPPPGNGGGTTGGTTTNAAALEDPKCVLPKEIECECFKGEDLIKACIKSGVTLDCLGPTTPYTSVTQKGLVLIEGKGHVLGALLCSGQSDETAFVTLPIPKG